jgi:hypothetical protein
MTLLAYGAKKVRALETTLGGKPPKKAADQALAALKQQMRERYERRNAQIAKMRPLMERSQAPLLELIKADKGAAASLAKHRSLTLARRKEKLRVKHERLKIDPRMVSGSGFWLKVPPYDVPFNMSAGDAKASSDINAGVYSLSMTGNGSGAAASAGVGIWFFATEDNPAQRIAALFDYAFSWLDDSDWYTAHNDGSTNIWVFGSSENAWLLQQGGFFPSWSDGTAGQGQNGSNSDGTEVDGRESLEGFFPVRANNWYLVFIWSEGSCDDSIGGLFGFSFAQQAQSMSVPYVLFGSVD